MYITIIIIIGDGGGDDSGRISLVLTVQYDGDWTLIGQLTTHHGTKLSIFNIIIPQFFT